MDREVQDLARYARSFSGAEIVERNGHVKVVKGSVMVVMPSTPGDYRWRKNAIAELRRAGLIDRDPRGKTPPLSASVKEAQLGRIAERRQRNDAVCVKAKRVLIPIGVWKPPKRGTGGSKGNVGEVARVAHWWAGQPEQAGMWRPASVASAITQWSHFFKQSSLVDDRTLHWIERFIDDLNLAPVPRSRYYSHLMESQKVAVTHTSVRPQEVVKDVPAVPPAPSPAPALVASPEPSLPVEQERQEEMVGISEEGVRFALELSTYLSAVTDEERSRLVEMLAKVARRCG